jgi:hypothetical protein
MKAGFAVNVVKDKCGKDILLPVVIHHMLGCVDIQEINLNRKTRPAGRYIWSSPMGSIDHNLKIEKVFIIIRVKIKTFKNLLYFC